MTLEKLLDFVNSGQDHNTRYRVVVSFYRHVQAPSYGDDAYSIDRVVGEWAYGKGNGQESAKEVSKRLRRKAKKFLHLCTSCDIVVWNGCSGYGYYLKESEETFPTDFNGKPLI